jgi:hypothetical protein
MPPRTLELLTISVMDLVIHLLYCHPVYHRLTVLEVSNWTVMDFAMFYKDVGTYLQSQSFENQRRFYL